MKVLITTMIALVIFSGCSSKSRGYNLLNRLKSQSIQIQRQQAEIVSLRKKLKQRSIERKRKRERARKVSALPPAPKKNIKLKKVEDKNYSSSYMYPGATKSTPKKVTQAPTPSTTTSAMSKEECISIIGQDKFDKYTHMFGSEAASLKRCKMLKAMRQ